MLKKVVNENREAFEELGSISTTTIKPDKGTLGGRPSETFELTVHHLILLSTLTKNTASTTNFKKDIILSLIKSLDYVTCMAVIQLIEDMDVEELQPDQYVYVAQEKDSKRFKIGISKNPERRIKELNTGNPEELILVHAYLAIDSFKSEAEAHRVFAGDRLKGEWFNESINIKVLPSYYCSEYIDVPDINHELYDLALDEMYRVRDMEGTDEDVIDGIKNMGLTENLSDEYVAILEDIGEI